MTSCSQHYPVMPSKQVPLAFVLPSLLDSSSTPRSLYLDEFKPSSRQAKSDIVRDFRIVLIFGKVIGLVQLDGILSFDISDSSLSLSNSIGFSAVYSLFIGIMLLGNAVVGVIGASGKTRTNAAEYAWAPGMFLFYAIALFGYVHYYRRRSDILGIFRQWNKLNLTFRDVDQHLFRDVTLMLSCLMASAIAENVLSSMADFLKLPSTEEGKTLLLHAINFGHAMRYSVNVKNQLKPSKDAGALEVYYIRSNENWAKLVPYHPLVVIYAFASNKFAWYALNYMDLTIAVFARALSFRFRNLYEHGIFVAANLHSVPGPKEWNKLAHDHEILCDMLAEINKFLSPLIFLSYGHNLYWTCISLHSSLTPSPNRSLMESIYTTWSFMHLMARILLVSLSAAAVNEWAQKMTQVVKKCSSSSYSLEMQRLEGSLRGEPMALSGLGCFTLTRPFVLHIISVVFTFEIVLLQASQTTLVVSPPTPATLSP